MKFFSFFVGKVSWAFVIQGMTHFPIFFFLIYHTGTCVHDGKFDCAAQIGVDFNGVYSKFFSAIIAISIKLFIVCHCFGDSQNQIAFSGGRFQNSIDTLPLDVLQHLGCKFWWCWVEAILGFICCDKHSVFLSILIKCDKCRQQRCQQSTGRKSWRFQRGFLRPWTAY